MNLSRIKELAKIRHKIARRTAKRLGRMNFPDLPFECSWAFEELYKRNQIKLNNEWESIEQKLQLT